MKLLALILIIGCVSSAPTSKEDETLTIDQDFFIDELSVYTSQHDIVNIYVPINALNFEEDEDDEVLLFFVEADITEGKKDYKGLYTLKGKNATKILDNGRDFSANNDDTREVFFGASDGIYTYKAETKTAEKYGSVTEGVISIAKENGTDVIYIVTDDKELYKVTENGNKKEKLSQVSSAEQIVTDYSNNLFYYGTDKMPYVYKGGDVKKIEGIPENPTEVRLLRPPFIFEDGVPFVVDDKIYMIFSNGTSELTDFVLQVKPTAYSAEATLIQYYAYNKKIYEYNILALALGTMLEDLKEYLSDKTDSINSIATRSRSSLRPEGMN